MGRVSTGIKMAVTGTVCKFWYKQSGMTNLAGIPLSAPTRHNLDPEQGIREHHRALCDVQ